MEHRSVGICMTYWALAAVLAACPAFAQEGAQATKARMFDPKTMEAVRGEVIRVDKVASPGGMGYRLSLTVKTEKETLPVEVAPGWYLEMQPVKIEVKDILRIKGFRVTDLGKPAVIAAEIKKGDQVLKLRDGNGFPVWSRGKLRPGK